TKYILTSMSITCGWVNSTTHGPDTLGARMAKMPWPSLAAMTAAAAERHGDRIALIEGESQVTFAELYEQARLFGAALVAEGVQRGDRVAIWCPNSRRWVVALLGILQAGATLVPINTRFKGREAADMISRGRARVLVTTTDFLDHDYVGMVRQSGVHLPELGQIVITSGAVPGNAIGWDEFTAGVVDAHLAEVDRRRGEVGP